MNWLVQDLWLIPALPLLVAGLSALAIRSAGAERRQPVAHGVSRGIKVYEGISSVGAKESDRGSTIILSPLRGLFDPDIPSHGVSRGNKVQESISSVGATQ